MMTSFKSEMEKSQRLVNGLISSISRHNQQSCNLIETHSAWVILSKEFAYKIKKPVNFGFLDFSTLEKRREYCHLEVELNSRFSADIYLFVVSISGDIDNPVIVERSNRDSCKNSDILDYAVKMRRFPAKCLLSDLAKDNLLAQKHLDQLIEIISDFHLKAEQAPANSLYGSPESISHWMLENLDHIKSHAPIENQSSFLESLDRWIKSRLLELNPIFCLRQKQGMIRNCHGDLHLKNLTLLDGKVRLFDCIEFNSELRWIDVMSEIAFLIMDLDERGYQDYAYRFLNGYLQKTGDYSGLKVLRFYLIYRALVRAKVAVLRCQQIEKNSLDFDSTVTEYKTYLKLVNQWLSPKKPKLLITFGLSGAGKSYLTAQLCEKLGFIHLRSDVERKRLAGLQALDSSQSDLNQGIYSPNQTENTYRYLMNTAQKIIESDYSVVVDATFLQKDFRSRAREVANSTGGQFLILECYAPIDTLRHRIIKRSQAGKDPSEADLKVLEVQKQTFEPLTTEEQLITIRIDTTDSNCLELLLSNKFFQSD